MKLEIVAVGAQGAAVAAEEGADRIELCSALELGGLTPSQGLMEAAQEAADGRLGIHPLIRSRPGDFLYSDADVDTMDREIRFLLRQGAQGVVIGVLTAAGDIDVQATRKLADTALETNPDAQLTFHRALDQTPDPRRPSSNSWSLDSRGCSAPGAPPRWAPGSRPSSAWSTGQRGGSKSWQAADSPWPISPPCTRRD